MSHTPDRSGDGALARADVAARLPAQDLERARAFFADKLGLQPVEEREGGLHYRCGSTVFSAFASAGGPSGQHTQMAWEVDDSRQPWPTSEPEGWCSTTTTCPV